MTKAELLAQLEISREAFLDVIDGLEIEDLTAPGVCGEWTIKDIIAHLSRWEAELVKILWQAEQGQRPTTIHFKKPFHLDQINHDWTLEMQSRTWSQVLEDFHAVRSQTILRVEALSEKDLFNPKRYPWSPSKTLAEWIENDSYGHEAEHQAEIARWLAARKGKSDAR